MRLDDLCLIARCRYDALLLTLSLTSSYHPEGVWRPWFICIVFVPELNRLVGGSVTFFMSVGRGPGFRIGTGQSYHCDISSFEGVLPRRNVTEILGS